MEMGVEKGVWTAKPPPVTPAKVGWMGVDIISSDLTTSSESKPQWLGHIVSTLVLKSTTGMILISDGGSTAPTTERAALPGDVELRGEDR